jgi:NADP-dependent 3-hydroxy acid dehydrogenase YdfG
MLPTVYDITNKVVFVMGARRGIGKGIAQVLAAGVDVVLNALTSRYAEQTTTAGKGGGEMIVYTLAKTALVGCTRAQALE